MFDCKRKISVLNSKTVCKVNIINLTNIPVKWRIINKATKWENLSKKDLVYMKA